MYFSGHKGSRQKRVQSYIRRHKKRRRGRGRVNAKAYGANVYFSKKKKNKNCVKEKIEKIKI